MSEKPTVTFSIDACNDCPHFVWNDWDAPIVGNDEYNPPRCTKKGRVLEQRPWALKMDIPHWCPLLKKDA